MAARLSALLPRLVALTLIWLLATSTITFAAGGRTTAPPPPPATPAPKGPEYLVVPDVRRQAYVFAKGILADGGFAWRVTGPVKGYAANTVVSQRPAPGAKVEDTGAPEIVLVLERNPAYPEHGLPENASPTPGTPVVLAGARTAPPAEQAPAEEAPAEEPPAEEPAPKEPADEPEKDKKKKQAEPADDKRAPAFVVKGAPPEPRDELPLPERAHLLEQRLAAHRKPTPALVNFWLYQHAWLVTGARFGWSGGAEALRVLVRVDRDLQARWGIGGKSLAVARAALAEVERRSR
jgi:PASTA domain